MSPPKLQAGLFDLGQEVQGREPVSLSHQASRWTQPHETRPRASALSPILVSTAPTAQAKKVALSPTPISGDGGMRFLTVEGFHSFVSDPVLDYGI